MNRFYRSILVTASALATLSAVSVVTHNVQTRAPRITEKQVLAEAQTAQSPQVTLSPLKNYFAVRRAVSDLEDVLSDSLIYQGELDRSTIYNRTNFFKPVELIGPITNSDTLYNTLDRAVQQLVSDFESAEDSLSLLSPTNVPPSLEAFFPRLDYASPQVRSLSSVVITYAAYLHDFEHSSAFQSMVVQEVAERNKQERGAYGLLALCGFAITGVAGSVAVLHKHLRK